MNIALLKAVQLGKDCSSISLKKKHNFPIRDKREVSSKNILVEHSQFRTNTIRDDNLLVAIVNEFCHQQPKFSQPIPNPVCRQIKLCFIDNK